MEEMTHIEKFELFIQSLKDNRPKGKEFFSTYYRIDPDKVSYPCRMERATHIYAGMSAYIPDNPPDKNMVGTDIVIRLDEIARFKHKETIQKLAQCRLKELEIAIDNFIEEQEKETNGY